MNKETAINLLNEVLMHCTCDAQQSAFKTLQDIDVVEFKESHYRNCILSCLDDLKKEFEEE